MLTSGRSIRDGLIYLGLAVGLLVFFLALYPIKGYTLPVGSDTPVYLWWARLAQHDGLSAVGVRPGVPVLTLVLGGTLGLTKVQALAGLAAACGASLGLAAAGLVTLASPEAAGTRDGKLRAALAGVFAGLFAAHLANGYMANLLQAFLFVAAGAALAAGSWRAAGGAGALLAAGALAHPLFFALGAMILVLAASFTIARRPAGARIRDVEGGRILAAVAGGGALSGIGFASLLIGPGVARGDTSEDATLRRAGLDGLLHKLYRSRFLHHVVDYVPPAQAALAVAGLRRRGGFLIRFLGSWAAVVVLGAIVALATGWIPVGRLFAFGFALPILAGIGLVRFYNRLRRRRPVAAAVASLALGSSIVVGMGFVWANAHTFMSELELDRAAAAGRIAAAAPPGTPLVFVVDAEHAAAFLAPRAANVIRDAVPPDRIRDVYVYVGSPERFLEGRPTIRGATRPDALSRLYLGDIREARGHPLAFVLAPLNRPYLAEARRLGEVVERGVIVLGGDKPRPTEIGTEQDVRGSSTWGLVLSGIAAFLLLSTIGAGWARALIPGPSWPALAPAFGATGLILATILFERLGVPLTGWGPPVISAAVAGSGYLLAFLSRGRKVFVEQGAGADPPPQVHQ